MPDATTVDKFPKTETTKADVERVRQERLDSGARSCDLSEDNSNWILTTVWPGDDA
jgi:hypothetical protein